MIVTAGTKTTKIEEDLVLQAVRNMGDSVHYADFIPAFEKEFGEYVGSKNVLLTTNGTGALHLALLALGIGKGDEVILPDMTYIACANVIAYTGATPVLVDINPETWCIDEKAVANAITKKTKAIMPVWMYGQVPNMDALLKFGVPLIEDSCPAVGSYFKDKHAGTFGEFGCFSFQAAKILAIGEGGALVSNYKPAFNRAKKLADHAETDKQFWHDEIGYMYLMSDIQAALGLGQLRHIVDLLTRKFEIYFSYMQGLHDLYPMNMVNKNYQPNFWMSSIITRTPDERVKMRNYLKGKGVDTRPFFYPISMFNMYKKRFSNPNAYDISLRGINLPSGVRRSDKEIAYVSELIQKFHKTY